MEICFLFFRVSVIVAAAFFFGGLLAYLKSKLFSFFWNGKFEVKQHKLCFGVIDNFFIYLSFWLNHYVRVSMCLYSRMCVTYITVQKKIKPVRLTLAARKVFFFSSDFAPFFHSFRTFSKSVAIKVPQCISIC